MQLELLNEQGQATSKVDAPDTLFGRDYNEALVHQIVIAFQANARQGTRAQLDRTMVKHSTKKPWPNHRLPFFLYSTVTDFARLRGRLTATGGEKM